MFLSCSIASATGLIPYPPNLLEKRLRFNVFRLSLTVERYCLSYSANYNERSFPINTRVRFSIFFRDFNPKSIAFAPSFFKDERIKESFKLFS